MNENIKGIKTGTTADVFFNNIIKANEKQALTIKGAKGAVEGSVQLVNNDTLIVMSADSANISKYLLKVSDEGLSSNAVLTSTRYNVTIEQQPKSAGDAKAGIGNIKGFDYGTSLRTILANVKLPVGATLDVVNSKGAYVPLKILNYDTTYVNVTVNEDIFLNVIAENGITQFIYQLLPEAGANDAFIVSDIYNVSQKEQLIEYVPRGTNVSSFMGNINPVSGASVKLLNKMGQERLNGYVADDDKVEVTSANGLVTKVYYISKLAEKYIPETTYLAYILSSFYTIDQVSYKIGGVSGDESVSAFMLKTTPAAGASAVVIDKDGNIKNTGNIDSSDMIEVTSADGKLKVYYVFGPLTSAGVLETNNIELYPNPTSSEINVSGVKAGQRIQVYNSVGAAIRSINVQESIERISLSNQPAGMYLIVVSDKDKSVRKFKALKK
jgi:hypothetical protein